MANQKPPRPEAVVADDGSLSNPEGWTLILVADDKKTVVAAWADDGTFWQWEDTESIVQQLMNALAMYQQAWGANVSGQVPAP